MSQIIVYGGGGGGGGGATTFDTDSGTAMVSGNTITIHGTHGINTSGAGSTVTIAINNAITLGDLSSIVGSPALTATTGDVTLSAGNINMPATNAAATEGVYTVNGVQFLSAFGSDNTFVGGSGNFTLTGLANTFVGGDRDNILMKSTGGSLTTGGGNVGMGVGVLSDITSGTENVAIGFGTGFNLVSGNENLFLGTDAGSLYTTSESNNVLLANNGEMGDQNVMRLGDQGSGAGQVNTCFIAGIQSVTTSNSVMVTFDSISTQLGQAPIPVSAQKVPYTAVNHAASPYVVLSTDYYIGVDVTAGVVTIQLPNAPATGTIWVVKDSVGLAATNNITVTTVGGVVNIDGATTFVMNTAYEAASFIFNGTSYEVF